MSEKYELIIFCNGEEATCAAVVDYIEQRKQYFVFRFYSRHALFENANFTIKYYDFLLKGTRSLENTLFVESIVATYCLHLFNGIPIRPYVIENWSDDKELVYLAKSLLDLAKAPSLQLAIGTTVRAAILRAQSASANGSYASGNGRSAYTDSIDKL